MCGGTLLFVPCSHVGHVFRNQPPYSFEDATISKNLRRLVDVWTDEYKAYFHKIMPDLDMVDAGDIQDRVELRNKLQCKSFKWYLDNIYPEAPLPKDFYHVGSVTKILLLLDFLNFHFKIYLIELLKIVSKRRNWTLLGYNESHRRRESRCN